MKDKPINPMPTIKQETPTIRGEEKYSKYIKCEVCKKTALENSVVCSEKCREIRLKRLEIMDKYAHPNGCDNCWGDLHQGCTEQCNREFEKYGELGRDLIDLIKLML